MPNTLLDNCMMYVSFDNDATDQVNAHDFTLVNSPIYQAVNPGFGTYSLRTNGSSQYAYTPDHADWDGLVGTGEWTVACWFQASLGTTQFMLNNWTATAGTRSWVLYLSSSTLRLRVEVSDVAKDVDWSSAISGATWYCCMVWRSGDSIYISVNDGTPVSTSLGAGASIDAWVNPMTWGARSVSPASYYNGYVAGLAAWNAAIPSSDRTAYYNSGSGLAFGSWAASGGGGVALSSPINGMAVSPGGVALVSPVIRGVL